MLALWQASCDMQRRGDERYAGGPARLGPVRRATRGRRGLERLLFGSVVEAVLRAVPVPVLAIKTTVTGAEATVRPLEEVGR